jgi:tRNA(fMet)-specific endonuclease VapC
MILDTNALSAFMEGDSGLFQLLENATRFCIPSIALGEYRFGIHGSSRKAAYEQWLRENLPGKEILAADETTATHYALVRRELKVIGKPIPWHDVWIAAITRQHRLPLLSRDKHFDHVKGLTRLSW